MRPSIKRGIGKKLFINFFFLAIIPLLVFTVFTTRTLQHVLHNDTANELSLVTNNIAVILNDFFAGRKPFLRHMSNELSEKLHEGYSDARIIMNKFRQYNKDYPVYKSFSIMDLHGQVKISTNVELGVVDLSSTDLYQRIMDGADFAVGFMPEQGEREAKLFCAAPIYTEDDKLFFILVGELKVQQLLPFFKDINLGTTGEAYLVNKNKQILIRPRILRGSPSNLNSLGISMVASGESGSDKYQNYRGIDVIGAYKWLPKLGWGVIAEQNTREAFSAIHDIKNLAYSLITTILAFIFLASFLLSQHITNPIRDLVEASRSIARGELDFQVSITTKDELAELGNNFNSMSEELRKAYGIIAEKSHNLELKVQERTEALSALNEELVTSNEELAMTNDKLITSNEMLESLAEELAIGKYFSEGVLDAMADGLVVLNADAKITQVNKAFTELSGYQAEQLIGSYSPYVFLPSEDLPRVNNAFKETLAKKSIRNFSLTIISHNGSLISADMDTSFVADNNGDTIAYFAIFKDRRKINSLICNLEESKHNLAAKVLERTQELEKSRRKLLENNEALMQINAEAQYRNQQIEQSSLQLAEAYRGLELATAELNREKTQSEAILLSIADGIVVTDFNNKVLRINPTAASIFQVNEREVLGKHILEVVNNPTILKSIKTALGAQEGATPVDIKIVNKSSQSTFYYSLQTSIAKSPSGKKIGVVSTFHDMTRERELEQLKAGFLQTVSHELRTPLTSIIGFLDLVLESQESSLSKNERRFLGNSLGGALSLQKLINDLLDLSKIEAQKMQLHYEQVSPYLVIAAVLEQMGIIAQEKSVQLTNLVDPNFPTIDADPDKFRQIFINLINNAIKFTPKGQVEISATYDDDALRFCVSDTGIGIRAEHMQLIFEKFRQVDNSSTREYEGTGLGLPIVKSLVELHNGQIFIESVPEEGSKFFVNFPRAKANQPTQDTPPPALADLEQMADVPQPLAECEHFLPDGSNCWSNTHLDMDGHPLDCYGCAVFAEHFNSANHTKKVILVLQDDPYSWKHLNELFDDQVFEIIPVEHEDDITRLLEIVHPQVLLIDTTSVQFDLKGLVARLRSQMPTKYLPICALSFSSTLPDGIDESLIDLIICKPLERNELNQKLKELCLLPVPQHNNKILIVDDDPTTTDLISTYLKREGFVTIRATNPQEVLELAINEQPALITIDHHMPEATGQKIHQLLKQNSLTQDIPVIIISISADESLVKDIGAAEVLSKPIDPEQLISAIYKHINLQKPNNILIVDDDKDIIELLNTYLQATNITSHAACNGKEALDFLRHKIPDLIILDIMMPVIDGFEFVEILKSRKLRVPIIVLTAKDLSHEEREKLHSDVDQYLFKKILRKEVFLNAVNKMLNGKATDEYISS